MATNAGRIDYAYHYLKKALGLTPAEAAALVGNMVHESYEPWDRGRPTLLGSAHQGRGGGGIGIVQWSEVSRKANLYAFARKEKKPWANFGVQLAFETYEMKSKGIIPYYDTVRHVVVSHGGKGIEHDHYSLPDSHILFDLKHQPAHSLRALTELIENKYETPSPGSFKDRYRDAFNILTEERRYGRIIDASWRK